MYLLVIEHADEKGQVTKKRNKKCPQIYKFTQPMFCPFPQKFLSVFHFEFRKMNGITFNNKLVGKK